MKKVILVLLASVLLLVAACAPTGEITPTETPVSEPAAVSTAVCGDGECDNSEICQIDSLETPCPADCGPCPSSLYAEPPVCGDDNCEKANENEFTVTIPSSIKINIANLGETLANTMEIYFKCYDDKDNRIIQHALLKNYNGVLFDDNFDNGNDEIRLKARESAGSKTVYTLNLKKWQQENVVPFKLKCNFEFDTHSPMVNKLQTAYIDVIA